MRTLILYNDIENPIRSCILDGDFSKYHNLVINTITDDDRVDEFVEWFYNEQGEFIFPMSEEKDLIESKQWDKVAFVTFLP